jgi:hypothetical protein
VTRPLHMGEATRGRTRRGDGVGRGGRAADTGRRSLGGDRRAADAGRRDCGGGLGTAAGNRSRLNGDGGAAVLRRLSGNWTGGESEKRMVWAKSSPLCSRQDMALQFVLEVDKPRRGGNMKMSGRKMPPQRDC